MLDDNKLEGISPKFQESDVEYKLPEDELKKRTYDTFNKLGEKLILETYRGNNCIATKTIKDLGISRQMFTNWQNKNPGFKEKLIELKEDHDCLQVQHIQSKSMEKLYDLVADGNIGALKYALSSLDDRFKQDGALINIENNNSMNAKEVNITDAIKKLVDQDDDLLGEEQLTDDKEHND